MNEKSSNREKIDKNFLENSGASASTIDAYGKSLKGFRKELNKTTKDGKEASATMKDYNEYLSKNGEKTIRSTTVKKDLGPGLRISVKLLFQLVEMFFSIQRFLMVLVKPEKHGITIPINRKMLLKKVTKLLVIISRQIVPCKKLLLGLKTMKKDI